VSLRRLTENDLDAVASWYDGADELRARIGKTESDDAVGLLAITRHKGGRTIGVMEYRVGVPEDGWLGFR
jgi:hypothetical protein